MIRVVVAEDSATAREVLLAILRQAPDIEIAGTAANGLEAVELTRRLRPDLVTMDIHMPVLDGFEATRRIMAEVPTPIVIVTSSVDERGTQASFDALRAGALAILEKPSWADDGPSAAARERLLSTVRALADVKVVRRSLDRAGASRPRASARGRVAIVAIAASTGGPAALARLLGALPADLPVPLVAVQHNARGFMPALASWLNAAGNLRVVVASPGERAAPGTLYLAPDDRHLAVAAEGRLDLLDEPPAGGFRPAATVLFRTVGDAYGPRALALVLTGMGTDGVEGLGPFHAAGGWVIAQDEASSVVFGMPGATVAAGLADEVLPLSAIAERIVAAAAVEVR